MSARVVTETGWVSGRKARAASQGDRQRSYKLAARGLIQIKALPGETVKYSAADVERVAAAKGNGE